MNPKHSTARRPARAACLLLAAVLLAGCAPSVAPSDAPGSTGTGTATGASSAPSEGQHMDNDALITLNDRLSRELGDAYVQGWIQDGRLHVATTDAAQLPAIEDAGAVGHLVKYSNAELREGIAKIMAWQAEQPQDIRSAIHAYSINPRSGGLTLSVDPARRQAVETALRRDRPAGDIPLDFDDSSGFASRAPATLDPSTLDPSTLDPTAPEPTGSPG